MSLPAANFYITNTQLQSVPLQSHVGGRDGDNLKSMAIINNRNTQFDTLQLPAHVEEAIKKERSYLQHLSVDQQQKRITQLLSESNQKSWQDWWDQKLTRNHELIAAVKAN